MKSPAGPSALLLLLVLAATPAFAHGGRYRGPASEISPGRVLPQPPPPRPPTQPRLRPPRYMHFAGWLFWWHANKDEILTRRVAKGRREDRNGTRPPSTEMVARVVRPALRKLVANPGIHPDIRGGALIALARAGGTPELRPYLEEHADRERGEDRIARESAVLALGLLGETSDGSRDFLIRIAGDRDDHFRVRCFAMISLGLLRDASPEVRACLLRRLDGREPSPDAPLAAIFAMGLIGDPARVPELVSWLDAGRIGSFQLSDLARAYLVAALGKTGDPRALEAVDARLDGRALNPHRSAAIALGQLLPRAEPGRQLDHLTRIEEYLANESDRSTRNFLLTSLGRIGGARGASPEVREACIRMLAVRLPDRRRPEESSHAALALGLTGLEGASAKSAKLRLRLADLIRGEFVGLEGDKLRHAAFATALGLLGDDRPETERLLLEILGDRGHSRKLRGAAAVALGMLRSPAAVEPLTRALRDREDRGLRLNTALAAGLVGGRRFVEPLIGVYRNMKSSQFALGSAALGLGWIGDRSAVRPLLVIIEPGAADGRYPDLTRALATVALGRLADRREKDPLDRLSTDLNHRGLVGHLAELLTIL